MDLLALLLAAAVATTPAYMVRLTLGGLPIYLPEIFILLAFGDWLLSLVIGRAPFHRISYWAIGPVIVFVVGATFSAVHAGHPALGPLKSWVLLPALFGFLTYQSLRARAKNWALFEWGLLAATSLVAVVGLGQVWLHPGRLESLFNSPNSTAMWLVPVFFILTPRYRQWPFLAGLLVSFAAIVLTHSLGGVLALIAGAITLLLTKNIRSNEAQKLTTGLSIGAVLLFSYLSLTDWLSRLLSSPFGDRLGGRAQIWQVGRLAVQQNFWFGLGPGTFSQYYLARVGLIFANPIEWSVPEPHNLYLATWLSSGLVGFVGFTWLLFGLIYRQVKAGQWHLLAAVVAIMVHGLVDTTYWKNDLAIIFFLIVALTAFSSSSISKPEIS